MQPYTTGSVTGETILFHIWNGIVSFFTYLFSLEFLGDLKTLATIIVILLIASICYSLVRIYEMKDEDKKKAAAAKKYAAQTQNTVGGISAINSVAGNPIWESIRTKLLSESQAEWRLAIIEADIYMDRMLDSKGFYGDTVGDKLKALTSNQLPSIQEAWEAHKVRNNIAHEGSGYVLTLPEVRRALAQYESVLRDLGVIV